ncbi:orotidine-5'-phosphate decarboxylase [Thiobacter aerophilum]|uniref:Orotidine 5'-phosphate decarboxylase n=1 Tax=Thiobacter aerophilum TaxID=3121275 RepID=A0ABV0EBT4_9BURK
MSSQPDPRIIVALDYSAAAPALTLVRRLDPTRCRLKVGKELFTAAGPRLVEQLVSAGFGVFLDLKFHDIPNTVGAACRAAAGLGVWMINVHALGGRAMLTAAAEALAGLPNAPHLVAVTVLTSMRAADLLEVGVSDTPEEAVERLTRLARDCGLAGVVCSAREAAALRARHGPGFLLVTPGIRPAGDKAHDQVRIATPAEAVRAGASHLVIGRPITQAPDPLAALTRIESEIEGMLP